MRPQRFTDYVLDLAKNAPGIVRVQTLAEAGDTKRPFGLAITTSSGENRWQFMGQLPDGAKHEGFTDEPVTGTPAPAMGDPATAGSPEAWLAAVLAGAECPEISAIGRWSTSSEGAAQRGITVDFHDGSRIFARQL
ncbi:hypothetical protein [Streptomyces nymphaeiformis]|jgi:hypothetical protein|uniref:Uncharacterized protein n=1 Tax=Streptomyces nymphaeiformis TaxID=2663842 RepID=A0A7W7U9U6_9ACTN|nr:hypothetical protein [Streptomyces nymphaeiformis]MBB4987508.1 hypothetical protein [Streptomyces nymphaeiformis]